MIKARATAIMPPVIAVPYNFVSRYRKDDKPPTTLHMFHLSDERRRGRFSTHLDGIEFLKGEEMLTKYQFGTMTAEHYFCSKCGIYTHHKRRSSPE